MSSHTSIASGKFMRATALAVFGLLTFLSAGGLVLTALAREPLWPNSLALVVINVFPVVGVLIALHRPGNAVAWLCLAIGMAWALEGALWGVALYGFAREWDTPQPGLFAGLGDALVMPGLFLMATLLLLLFPDGHLPSSRWRWLGWLSTISITGMVLVGVFDPASTGWGRPEYESPLAIEDLGVLEAPILLILFSAFFCVLASIVALVRRYWTSTGIERLQLKWLMASGTGAALIWFVAILLVEPVAGEDAAVAVTVGAFALIPLAIGFAVLRYRLYNIDRIISRTLVYGSLTALLVLGFTGGILLFQLVLSPFTSGNDLAVAGSTLLVFALFRPLRGRIQSVVDRRFFRQKYDAERTLQTFSTTARDAVDPDQLTRELTDIVSTTMQPEHVSVWLREPEAR